MKLREGFVSNSSSASYIVRIKNISLQEFCDRLAPEYYQDELNIKITCGIIKRRIKDINRLRKKAKGKDLGLDKMYERHKEVLEKLEKRGLKILDVEDFVKEVEFIFEYEDINVCENNGDVVLDYFTSIHNDYNDGMGDLLKEITLFFMFETHYEVECRVEHH